MKLRSWAFLLVLILALTTVIFAQQPPKVRSEMLVSTDWLAQHTNDPGVIILHVTRYHTDYERGHIPGAHFLPSYRMVSDNQELPVELPSVGQLKAVLQQAGVGNKGRIVLYAPGQPTAATRAYFTLDYLGLGDRVALLDGGLEKWKSEKRTLSTETPKFSPGTLTVHPRPEIVAHYDQVRRIADGVDTSAIIVDARPPQRYKEGHLPGAVPLFWVDTIDSRDMPLWKPSDKIRAKYEAAGLKPGSKIITYCEVGNQASHGYFTAKYLGYDVALYDGSYDEWTNSKDAPVVKGESRR